jgi:protein transport protein SEC13
VRIFQINDNQTETLLSILSGHEGPVWQIAWAHPKFGSILASCSYDGTVVIWREDAKKSSSSAGVTNAETHSSWSKIKIHKFHKSSGIQL